MHDLFEKRTCVFLESRDRGAGRPGGVMHYSNKQLYLAIMFSCIFPFHYPSLNAPSRFLYSEFYLHSPNSVSQQSAFVFCILYSVFCFFFTFPVAFCILYSVFCDLALLPTPLEMVDLGFCDLALLTLAFGSGPVFCDSVFCDFATPDKVGTELSSVSVRMKWLIHRGIF